MGGGAMMQPEYMGAPAVLGYGVWGHSLPLRVWGHHCPQNTGYGISHSLRDLGSPTAPQHRYGVTHGPWDTGYGVTYCLLGFGVWGHPLPQGSESLAVLGMWDMGSPPAPQDMGLGVAHSWVPPARLHSYLCR